MPEQKEQNISHKLLDMLQQQRDKTGLAYHQDHWHELGFTSQLDAEMHYHHGQENRTDEAAPVEKYPMAKNPYSTAISAKRVANGRKPFTIS